MQTPQNVREHKNIILFDGVCNLCSGFLNFVYRNDPSGVFKFAWIQESDGTEILKWLDMPTDSYKTILYIKNGQPYFKSTAFLKIVKLLRKPWPLFQVGYILPKFVRDGIYDFVAKHRYSVFGKKDACLMPTGDLKSRFL
jgi:predicted DCC family thiol-disulfide oxidoreductase YuxK